MAITKEMLSGSANGKPILVLASASPGTVIHTSVSGTVQHDQVFIWAYNLHTAPVILTIEFGGTTSSEQIVQTIPSRSGWVAVIPGLPLNNACVVRAFSDNSGSKILLAGYARRGP